MAPPRKPPIDIGPVSRATAAPPATPPPPTSFASGNVQYAGFWRRVAAAIVDGILIQVVANILVSTMNGTSAMANADYLHSVSNNWAALLSLVYFIGLESSAYQATAGKMLLGIKVTDLQGRRLDVLHAAIRQISKILSALILCIGFIMVAFTEKKQGLHDMIAGALVVRK